MSVDSDLPVDVQEIVIHGNKRTKTSFFASCLHDSSVISKNSDKSLSSYVSDLQKLNAKLLESNLFESVEGNLQIESRTNGRCKVHKGTLCWSTSCAAYVPYIPFVSSFLQLL